MRKVATNRYVGTPGGLGAKEPRPKTARGDAGRTGAGGASTASNVAAGMNPTMGFVATKPCAFVSSVEQHDEVIAISQSPFID